MAGLLEHLNVEDGDAVRTEDIPAAVTAGTIVYDNGTTQVFDADGGTVFFEQGDRTTGEWYVDDDGRFCSFWPPDYRACYDLFWIMESGKVAGLAFAQVGGGDISRGRYQS